MKVKDLIAKLNALNPEALVITSSYDGNLTSLDTVEGYGASSKNFKALEDRIANNNNSWRAWFKRWVGSQLMLAKVANRDYDNRKWMIGHIMNEANKIQKDLQDPLPVVLLRD